VGGLGALLLGGQFGDGIHQVDDDVGVLGPAPGRADHGAVELAARLEDAGSVDQDDLSLALHCHAAYGEAGGLHLLGDDRDLRPDQAVGQGRLARIGGADDGGEAGAGGHCSFNGELMALVSNTSAASFSASRLEPPRAVAGSRLGTRTSTVKTGSWAEPSCFTTW